MRTFTIFILSLVVFAGFVRWQVYVNDGCDYDQGHHRLVHCAWGDAP